MAEKYVRSVAGAMIRHLTSINGGSLPGSAGQIVRMGARLGVGFDAVATPGFEADAVEWQPGRFSIRYQRAATGTKLFRLLLHEMVEILAIRGVPGLFDGTADAAPIRYDGGAAVKDIRHLVAGEVVRDVCRTLGMGPETKTVAHLTPAFEYRYARARPEIVREAFFDDEPQSIAHGAQRCRRPLNVRERI